MPAIAALHSALVRLRGGAHPCLALEADENGARILLVRRSGNRLVIERILTADLRTDGLLGPAEMAARLRSLLATLPVAHATLVLPPGRTHSQLMPLRGGDTRAIADLARTVGGSQFESVPSVFDARPLRPTSGQPPALWVSIAREADVELHLLRCGLPSEQVDAIIGADAALAAAFATLPQRPPLAALLELGATASLLVVVENDQPAFAVELDWGLDQLPAALAQDLRCPPEHARTILARDGAETLNAATPRLAAALDRLRQHLDLLLQDYARETARPSPPLLSAPCWLSGPGLASPANADLLARAFTPGRLQSWPAIPSADGQTLQTAGGALAYGAAAIALALAPPAPNLAPPAARAARRAETWIGLLHAAALALALFAFVFLTFDLFARQSALTKLQAEAVTLRSARATVPSVIAARAEREAAELSATPQLYFQKRTRDFITGARLLREQRSGGDFWFALVADQETYRAGSLPRGTPYIAPELQLLPGCLTRSTGLVVELGFRPGVTDPLARVGALIADLNAARHFTSVDLLPARARQTALSLADRSVFAAEGADYALQLDSPSWSGSLPATESTPGTRSPEGLFQPFP